MPRSPPFLRGCRKRRDLMRRVNGWYILAVALFLALVGPAAAQDEKAADKVVYETLRDIINKGADMYNSGDVAGCYRLYEGALMVTKPLLTHRGPLQKSIETGLANAARTPSQADRAFVLRR